MKVWCSNILECYCAPSPIGLSARMVLDLTLFCLELHFAACGSAAICSVSAQTRSWSLHFDTLTLSVVKSVQLRPILITIHFDRSSLQISCFGSSIDQSFLKNCWSQEASSCRFRLFVSVVDATWGRNFMMKHQLFSQFENFDLDAAECSNESDREFVYAAITHLYGSKEAFTQYVRGPLQRELLEPICQNVLPRTYTELLTTPFLSLFAEFTLAVWKQGAPVDLLLIYIVSWRKHKGTWPSWESSEWYRTVDAVVVVVVVVVGGCRVSLFFLLVFVPSLRTEWTSLSSESQRCWPAAWSLLSFQSKAPETGDGSFKLLDPTQRHRNLDSEFKFASNLQRATAPFWQPKLIWGFSFRALCMLTYPRSAHHGDTFEWPLCRTLEW